MEVSPYIYSPFKIATSQSDGLGMKNVVELRASDVSQSSRVFAMELRYEFWCEDSGSRLPGIVFVAISLPLNEVLESSLVPMTVEYFVTNFIQSYLYQIFDDSHGLKASLKPLKKPFNRCQSRLEAINNS